MSNSVLLGKKRTALIVVIALVIVVSAYYIMQSENSQAFLNASGVSTADSILKNYSVSSFPADFASNGTVFSLSPTSQGSFGSSDPCPYTTEYFKVYSNPQVNQSSGNTYATAINYSRLNKNEPIMMFASIIAVDKSDIGNYSALISQTHGVCPESFKNMLMSSSDYSYSIVNTPAGPGYVSMFSNLSYTGLLALGAMSKGSSNPGIGLYGTIFPVRRGLYVGISYYAFDSYFNENALISYTIKLANQVRNSTLSNSPT